MLSRKCNALTSGHFTQFLRLYQFHINEKHGTYLLAVWLSGRYKNSAFKAGIVNCRRTSKHGPIEPALSTHPCSRQARGLSYKDDSRGPFSWLHRSRTSRHRTRLPSPHRPSCQTIRIRKFSSWNQRACALGPTR